MIEVRRLGPQIGAEINGVDVRRLDDTTFSVIYRAWLDYNVVAVRGQQLQIAEFLAYSRRFGLIEPHPSKITRHPDCAEVTLRKLSSRGAPRRGDLVAHADRADVPGLPRDSVARNDSRAAC